MYLLRFQSFELTNINTQQKVKSKIAYSTDTWTTKQMVFTFACTIALFVDDDWKLIEWVVDFKPLNNKDHEEIHGRLAFVNSVCKRGGLAQMNLSLNQLFN